MELVDLASLPHGGHPLAPPCLLSGAHQLASVTETAAPESTAALRPGPEETREQDPGPV
jgi:hypothetical protein